MNGFIIVNLSNGMCIYHKQYVDGFGFKTAAAEDGGEGSSSITDPINLASYFFSNMQLVEAMAQEIRESMGGDVDELVEAQLAEGFRGLETEGVSFVVERSSRFNLLIALFYDSDVFQRKIAEMLCNKIIDIFVHKYEKKLEKKVEARKYDTFDSALTMLYEDTISDMIKQLFLNLGSQSIIVPWLFLVYTKTDDFNIETEAIMEPGDKRKHSLNSTHFSKNEGLSGVANNQESDPEIEFAYNSDEDSVISAYAPTNEKKHIPKKLFKKTTKGTAKNLKRKVAEIVKEINEEPKSLKMLFKFNVDLEEGKQEEEKKFVDSSRIHAEEENDKKSQLKNDFVEFKNSRYFNKDVNKDELMRKLFEVIINANNVMKLTGDNQTFNSIEMSLNKNNVLLDKSKMLIVKMGHLILMVPIKISRIEVKLRNTFFINEQPQLSALAMFIEFFLETYTEKQPN